MSYPTTYNGIETTCARLTVPLDYSDPSSRTTSIALMRVHRPTTGTPIPVVVNPGGPGGSGIDLARTSAFWASELLDHADIIGVDPRGIGESGDLSCADPQQPDDDDTPFLEKTPDQRRVARESIGRLIDNCTAKYPYFEHINTVGAIAGLEQAYPLVGAINVYRSYICSQLPTRRHPLPVIPAASTPTLVVGSLYDAPTPYSDAVDVAARLGPQAVLLTYDGPGHGSYLESTCVAAAANAYLVNLTLPSPDTHCPSENA